MEEIKEKATDLADHVEDLANTYYRLALANVTQKTSNIVSGVVVVIMVCIMAFFFLFFAGLALGWWLGNLVENRALGFLLAAGFFLLLLAGIILLKKKTIVPMIRNMIIQKIYND